MNKPPIEDWLLRCPLCHRKLWYSNIENHRNLKHTDIDSVSFEKLLIDAVKRNKAGVTRYVKPPKNLVSSTQKLNIQRKVNKHGIRKMVPGGRVNPR